MGGCCALDIRLTQALSHPLRIAILGCLEQQNAAPGKLAQRLRVARCQLDYHVKVLHDLELIRPTEEVQASEPTYEIMPPLFTQLLPQRALKHSPNRPPVATFILQVILSAGISVLKSQTFNVAGDSRLSHLSATFDKRGLEEVNNALNESERRISSAKANAARRLAEAGGGGTVRTIAFAGFQPPVFARKNSDALGAGGL